MWRNTPGMIHAGICLFALKTAKTHSDIKKGYGGIRKKRAQNRGMLLLLL